MLYDNLEGEVIGIDVAGAFELVATAIEHVVERE